MRDCDYCRNGLYVPWHQSATVIKWRGGEEQVINPEDCGYGLVFLLKRSQRIDAGRLGVQCGLVALIAAGLIVTFRNPVKGP